MNVRTLLLVLLLGWGAAASAQGFAGLGADAEGFARPERGVPLVFPRDHGAHPAYRIEWWYVTANLTGDDGRAYGVQWTLFRSASAPEDGSGWDTPQLWMGHAALTTPDAHFATERLARGGIGQAGAEAAPFAARIDEWHLAARPGSRGIEALSAHAQGPDFAWWLEMDAQGPLVLHGDGGYSVKSQGGQASYYYSQPFYSVRGRLRLADGGEIEVTGQAWLDREWSSQPLSDSQSGWDWFSLHLEGGAKLMGFRVESDGALFTSATWIGPDGTVTAYGDGALQAEPLETSDAGPATVPTTWRVRLPGQGVDVTLRALNPGAWMPLLYAYWEGPVTIEGSHRGTGYLEMTGYDQGR